MKFQFFLIMIYIIPTLSQPSPFGFQNQFIGNYVPLVEEQKRQFCQSYFCTNDANYLFTQSGQYPNIDPCVDFRNFSVGKFIEIDKVNDRKLYKGTQTIIEGKFDERVRRILKEKIVEANDNRMVKVVKNNFKKCLESPHTFRHLEAHKLVKLHLNKFNY